MYSDRQFFQVLYWDLFSDHPSFVGSVSITTERKRSLKQQEHQNKLNTEIKLKSVTPIAIPSIIKEKETAKM